MYSLCLDCGATNVRAMVVDKQGAIVGKASQPNATLCLLYTSPSPRDS